MPTTLKTPGVYVEEISKFPPSVAAVETAIPAFVGYTQYAGKNDDLYNTPVRITSLLEYEALFGGAPAMDSINVTLDNDFKVAKIEPAPTFYLYNSLRLFFANGGGPCYIVSVAPYEGNTPDATELTAGFAALELEDEPTLLLAPDACLLPNRNDCMNVYAAMMAQCETLQDRFAVMDIYERDAATLAITTNPVNEFRNNIPSNSYLKYGAAYYPFLQSSIGMSFNHGKVNLLKGGVLAWNAVVTDPLLTSLETTVTDANSIATIMSDSGVVDTSWAQRYKAAKELDEVPAVDIDDNRTTVLEELIADIDAFAGTVPAVTQYVTNILNVALATIPASGTWSPTTIDTHYNKAWTILTDLQAFANSQTKSLETQLSQSNSFYAYIKQAVETTGLTLPPSGAIAGVYARVDSTRGVWKAPANVGLTLVSAPAAKISFAQHGDLNVHTSGKSINAIRSYTGKGVMVQGARTLAGNDNEWRYVSVRRFFNFVEESTKKATEQFVFEPNDANTWIRIKGMINNFLYNQWRAGALAGAKPEEAFYVKVGLPETMTAQDILEGRLTVEIGMAVVRPAEFIVLNFSHLLQTS